MEYLEWDIFTRVLGVRGDYQGRGNGRWLYKGFKWKDVTLGIRVGEVYHIGVGHQNDEIGR